MVMYAQKIEHISKYTDQDLIQAEVNGVSKSLFHQRLNQGWTVSQAIKTPVRTKKYYTEYELELMSKNKLTKKQVNSRISNGIPRELAIRVPANERCTKKMIEEYELEKLKLRKEAEEDLKRKNLKKQEELKRKKPHLFSVPQTSEFGDYAQQLFKDCFGSW